MSSLKYVELKYPNHKKTTIGSIDTDCLRIFVDKQFGNQHQTLLFLKYLCGEFASLEILSLTTPSNSEMFYERDDTKTVLEKLEKFKNKLYGNYYNLILRMHITMSYEFSLYQFKTIIFKYEFHKDYDYSDCIHGGFVELSKFAKHRFVTLPI